MLCTFPRSVGRIGQTVYFALQRDAIIIEKFMKLQFNIGSLVTPHVSSLFIKSSFENMICELFILFFFSVNNEYT